jgi:hypothetical protein
MAHPINWFVGWSMILAAFLIGAVVGMGFRSDSFLGGYTSFRRRIIRLGHIALVELGILNVIYSLSPWPAPGNYVARAASLCFVGGGLLMPLVCFLTGWRDPYRKFFVVPVLTLVMAIVFTLIGAWP